MRILILILTLVTFFNVSAQNSVFFSQKVPVFKEVKIWDFDGMNVLIGTTSDNPGGTYYLLDTEVPQGSLDSLNFCDGWEQGYEAGYCYRDYGCVAPVAPVCPIPDPGMDSYQDGYNRGFTKGQRDKQDENRQDGPEK